MVELELGSAADCNYLGMPYYLSVMELGPGSVADCSYLGELCCRSVVELDPGFVDGSHRLGVERYLPVVGFDLGSAADSLQEQHRSFYSSTTSRRNIIRVGTPSLIDICLVLKGTLEREIRVK